MQVFNSLQSLVIPLNINNVDTDMIIPAQFLKKIDRQGYGKNLFQRLRERDKEFVFNNSKYHSAEILITRANFGCGSSREHAVWALNQAGIKVIIAQSYSDIFYSNAAKNGLLLITLAEAIIEKLIKKAEISKLFLHIDLSQQTILLPDSQIIHFDYDPFRKTCLLKGQDDMDYLLEATR